MERYFVIARAIIVAELLFIPTLSSPLSSPPTLVWPHLVEKVVQLLLPLLLREAHVVPDPIQLRRGLPDNTHLTRRRPAVSSQAPASRATRFRSRRAARPRHDGGAWRWGGNG